MWTMTDDDKANARGGMNSPAAREAQQRMQDAAQRRRARAAKQAVRMARMEGN